MAHTNLLLSIRCFGALQITLNGRALPAFDTDKTGALLAYLLIEGQALRRAQVAAFFWPEMGESRARANLSQALYLLRKAIPTDPTLPLLLADARAVQVNPALPFVCDATQLEEASRGCDHHQPRFDVSCEACLAALQPVGDLYRGELLAGLSLPDCAEFEEWLRTQRQYYHRLTCTALQQLADWQQQRGDHAAALATCHQWLAIDPLAEAGHHQLMTLLAQSDQRAALAAFERYRQRLQTELNAEPTAPITSLYLQLRNNLLILRQDSGQVSQSPNLPMIQSPHFVGRPAELAHLQSVLSQAVVGQGRAIFVTGEAGFGKSALIQAFAQHAQQQFPALLVAGGNCNAYTGFGDPYLPLREILALLTGDTETQQQAGALTSVHTARLQTLAPQAIHALIEVAPDLLGTLIAPTALLTRSAKLIDEPSVKAQLQRLAAQKAREQTHSSAARPQTAIFEQVTKLLQRLAATAPLLLLVDDLQWADMGTISLLFHLARHLSHSPILLVGAFRPSEVLAGNQSNGQRWATGAQHPLAALYYEMQRQWGAIEVALEAADGQSFVAALVDRQPNQLDAAFRTRLHQYTHGNALFTVELLAGMQARGDLVRAADGRWLASATLDWETLPPRIEGVIAQRVARLPVDLRETLALASVMGENFHAEVLAGVQGVDRRQMVRWLSSELDRQHGLVTLQGIEPRGEQAITRYRFRHILFQKYLYQRLDAAERTHLHSAVGAVLEAIYYNQPEASEAVAGELARHYEQAGSWLKAAEWLLIGARRALRVSALDEAIQQAKQGVTMLKRVAPTMEQMKIELGLEIILGIAIMTTQGYNAPEVVNHYERAEELCKYVGEVNELFNVLHGLCVYHRLRRGLQHSVQLSDRMIRLVESQDNLSLQVEAHTNRGTSLLYMGNFQESYYHLARGREIAKKRVRDFSHHSFGQDPTVFCYCNFAWVLWFMGYPDQSLQAMQTALNLSREIEHPNSLAIALTYESLLYLFRREPVSTRKSIVELIEIATTSEHTFWVVWSTGQRSWLESELGDLDAGIAMLRNHLPDDPRLSKVTAMTWHFGVFATQLAKKQEYDAGLRGIEMVLDYGNITQEHWWEAELHRLRGKLLLLRDPNLTINTRDQAEESFWQAITVARNQGAKSWELRAATSLAKLWQSEGRIQEAHDLLSSIYGWFTEGFDSYDLQKAKSLLQTLETKIR